MAVSPSVVCLNTSRHRLYKLSQSTSMPNLTTGYSTVTWVEVVFFSKKKKKRKKLVFTPCKAEQPLQGMELQQRETQKDQSIQESYFEKTHS